MAKSNSNRVRIRKTDSLRAILTDTLPYEVPLLFTNEGLYLAQKNGITEKIDQEFDLAIFSLSAKPTAPYQYKIRKNAFDFRALSVMHPRQQIIAAAFYAKYDDVIVGLFQRSKFSLRAPSAVASYYVERVRAVKPKNLGKPVGVEQDTAGFESVPAVATSYFAYKNYTFMFRFYDSAEFLNLEKKFKFLSKLDISDCFNRIYSHTIAWATKSRSYAKLHKGKDSSAFENSFDALMQNANHGETAGIIIGPEVSRIFAEIILQRVDQDIEASAHELGLENDVDYTIRRYVDDYFVYTNNATVCDDIKRIIGDRLAEYKLSISTTKTVDHLRPFITNPTIVRHKISIDVSDFFDRHREPREATDPVSGKKTISYEIKNTRNLSATVSQTIAAIKRSIGESGSYDASSNYFFGTIKKLLSRLAGKPFSSSQGNLGQNIYYFMSALVDIVFFYYSMTPRVRQTYLTSEIILLILKVMKKAPDDLKDSIIRKIVHESRLVIFHGASERGAYKVEVMNLLLVLRSLGPKYLLDLKSILKLFDIEKSPDNSTYQFSNSFDYFQCVFLLSYLRNETHFKELLDEAVLFFVKRLEKEKDWQHNAELVFIILDLLACPYIDGQLKITLAKAALRHVSEKDLNERADKFIVRVKSQNWFFAWDQAVDIGLVLRKKELRVPYQ